MVQSDNDPPKLRGPPPGATKPPDHVKEPHIYEIFHPASNPERALPTNPSAVDGAGDSAGAEGQPSNPSRPTLKEGFESIKTQDFLKLHQIPCAREGLLTGIGAGAITGVGRYLVGGMFYLREASKPLVP